VPDRPLRGEWIVLRRQQSIRSIIFEAGNQQADTAYAELTQALRVRIFGAPSGTIVDFSPASRHWSATIQRLRRCT